MRKIYLSETAKVKTYQRKIRLNAIAKYGGTCICCGESESRFLTFNHVNNDGVFHRRELAYTSGHAIVHWVRKNNYPDNIQLLCYNCNHAKTYGGCPHKEKSNS